MDLSTGLVVQGCCARKIVPYLEVHFGLIVVAMSMAMIHILVHRQLINLDKRKAHPWCRAVRPVPFDSDIKIHH